MRGYPHLHHLAHGILGHRFEYIPAIFLAPC
jgi:hypothetical protein